MSGLEHLRGRKAVIWVRCSTEAQSDTSLPAQRAAIQHFAAQHEIELVGEIEFAESASVEQNIDRAVERLISMKATLHFDLVIAYDPSRVTRTGGTHTMAVRHRLRSEHIELQFAMSPLPQGEFADFQLFANSMGSKMAVTSSASAIARGSQSALERGRIVHTPITPYGTDRLILSADGTPVHILRNLPDGRQQRLDPRDGTVSQVYAATHFLDRDTGAVVVPDSREHRAKLKKVSPHFRKSKDERATLTPGAPEHTTVVRRIFDELLSGRKGFFRIAEGLNNDGILGPTGGLWTTVSCMFIARNPVYTGRGVANRWACSKFYSRRTGSPVEASTVYGPLHLNREKPRARRRSQEDWILVDLPLMKDFLPTQLREQAEAYQAQYLSKWGAPRAVTRRSKHIASPYLLSGLLRSVQGGLEMTGLLAGTKESPTRYYGISRAYSAPTSDRTLRRRVNADAIERLVVERLKTVVFSMTTVQDHVVECVRSLTQRDRPSKDPAAEAARRQLVQLDRNLRVAFEVSQEQEEQVFAELLRSMSARRAALQRIIDRVHTDEPWTEERVRRCAAWILKEFADRFWEVATIPPEALKPLLRECIQSLTVDLETMTVNLVMGVPSFERSDMRHMGLDPESVYPSGVEAHNSRAPRNDWFVLWRFKRCLEGGGRFAAKGIAECIV